jgi:hypothetical protein
MEKFISIPVGSDSLLVKVTGIVKILPDGVAPTTETEITYLDGTIVSLTHAATTGNAFIVSLQGVIEKALVTAWDKPVYAVAASDLDQAVSAIA